jgi:polysaccharide export outer membrane protein
MSIQYFILIRKKYLTKSHLFGIHKVMNNLVIKKLFNIFIITLVSIIGNALLSFAAEPLYTEQPSVLAPEGLSEKEKAQLERQYRYEYRKKDLLLTPYVSVPGGPEVMGEEELKALNEEEKLYRYFGIANELYQSGQEEEAIEVLKYILYKKPGDEYVKNFLKKIMEETKRKKADWKKAAGRDAKILKDQQIKELVRDGIDYYTNKDFDAALLKFADAISLDPANTTAKTYLNKLKKHYLLETRVEDIVIQQESEPGEEKSQATKDEQAVNTEETAAQETQNLSEDEKLEQIIKNKRAESLYEEAELRSKVQEILQQQRDMERKANSFVLGPGDVVQIAVRDHPELSGRVTVDLSGKIPLPLTGDVVVARGLSIEELNAEITKVIQRYVKEPQVNITLLEYRSKIFYVVDEMGATPYPIPRPNFTLRDALFVSDWGDDRALGRVLIVKGSKLHPLVKSVNAFDIIYRGNLMNNMRIENGDMIYIPQTYVGKANKVITDSFGPIMAVGQGLGWSNESVLNVRRLKGQNMKKIERTTWESGE